MIGSLQIYPSMLAADFAHLGRDLGKLSELGCTQLHIDVMDGQFVPPVSFGEPVIASLRKSTDLYFDVHMMVREPERHIESMKESGAQRMTVHAEACTHLDRVLQAIREAGMEAGAALNPATPLCVLEHVLDRLDQVLIMTVNPGYGGQSYLPAMTEKIRRARRMFDEAGYPELAIQVDGGIGAGNIRLVREAGAERIVAGSAVFRGDIGENYRALLKEGA